MRDGYRLTVRRFEAGCPDDHNEDCCPHKRLGRDTPIHKALVTRSHKCPTCRECECVLLAAGALKTDTSKSPQIVLDDDSWKWRRVVYTNPALGGLIQCFHGGLAHITGLSWKPGSRHKVDEFLHLLGHDHLRVTFDRPLNKASVERPQTCRLSIFIARDGEGCPMQILIPVRRIEYDEKANLAAYYFDHYCAEQDLRPTCHGRQTMAEVELVLHGSMILDTHGRALDAELIRDFPTGNGVEAGEFIAYFTVEP